MFRHVCPKCAKVFDRPAKLLRHLVVHTRSQQCDVCNRTFANAANLARHKQTHQLGQRKCKTCGRVFTRAINLKKHVKLIHGPKLRVNHDCMRCDFSAPSWRRLVTHIRVQHSDLKQCDQCELAFRRVTALRVHQRHHRRPTKRRQYVCVFCRRRLLSSHMRAAHWRTCSARCARVRALLAATGRKVSDGLRHAPLPLARRGGGAAPAGPTEGEQPQPQQQQQQQQQQEEEEEVPEWETVAEGFNGHAKELSLVLTNARDLNLTLIQYKQYVIKRLEDELKEFRGVMFQLGARVGMSREKAGEGVGQVIQEEKPGYLESEPRSVKPVMERLSQAVEDAILDVVLQGEQIRMKSSDWIVTRVFSIELKTARHMPLGGKSFLKLPPHLRNSKLHLVNVRNRDAECFRWCVLAALHPAPPASHPERVGHYRRYYNSLNFGFIESANMAICDIPRFERLNHLSINVLGLDEGQRTFYPLYCPPVQQKVHITLLLLTKGEKSHYVLVRDQNALLSSVTKHKAREWYCPCCLNHFGTEQLYTEHVQLCSQFGAQKTEMPKPGSFVSFNSSHYSYCELAPFTLHYDFETCVKKVEEVRKGKGTVIKQEHIPVAYCITVADHYGRLARPPIVHAAAEGVASHFFDTLLELENELWGMRKNYPIHMSAEQAEKHQLATHCELCRLPFVDTIDALKKVADHVHYEPLCNYRAALHNKCNLARCVPSFLPVVAHNAFGYDISLLLRWGLKDHPSMANKDIFVIAKTKEKYRGMRIILEYEEKRKLKSKRELRFLDSFQFYNAGLQSIAKSLCDDDLSVMHAEFPCDRQRHLLTSKGIYCYEFAQNYDQLVNTTTLPPRQDFYSSLTDSVPSEDEYQHAQNVWTEFKCSNLLDYLLVYLKCDTYLLHAFFSRYRMMTYHEYAIDPIHTWSAPGLSYLIGLKMTGAKVELITDSTQYCHFEAGLRGGQSFISKKYQTSNCAQSSQFDPKKPTSYILNTDLNALYNFQLQGDLPIGSFEWVSPAELSLIDWHEWDDTQETNYCLTVDLEYPEHLWEAHCEMPAAPTHAQVPRHWYSQEQKRLFSATGLQPHTLTKKLISYLGPRKNYTLHASVLKYYLQLGLKLTRIVRGCKFRQAKWAKPYLAHLAEKRQASKHQHEIDYYKLLGNSFYGRLLRRPRNDVEVKLCTKQEQFDKRVNSPLFKSFQIFGPNLIAVELKPKVLKLNQPLSSGVCVLDGAKVTLLKTYWTLKDFFKENMRLLFSDTDSLGIWVQTETLTDDLHNLRELFDFSSLDNSHPLYSRENERVPGKLKLEMANFIITDFVGLRSKQYAMKYESPRGEIEYLFKCKGAPKAAVRKQFQFQDYYDCLFDWVSKDVTFCAIRTDGKHNLNTIQQTKCALRAFCDKRRLCADRISTQAYRVTEDGREINETDSEDES